MKRQWMNAAHVMLLLVAVSAWADPGKAPKFEKPKNGMGRYALVLWEPGTPIPGDEKNHMKKIDEPDYAKLGGTLLFSNANRRVVDLPVKEARKLDKDPAVATIQRLWMGEPQAELEEPPPDSIMRRGIETEADTDLTWGPKAYQYDGQGNIKAIGADSFVYDTAGRLIRSTVGGKTETFQYDAFGNLTEKTVAGTNPVKIPVDGASNRMIGGGYDANGNVTMREGREAYVYDELNMLSRNNGRHMVYDANDERIGVIIDSQLSRWWIRDFDGNVLREFQGQAANQVWYWEQDWVYAEGQLVGGERVTFDTRSWESQRFYIFGGKRHYHLDHLGSVRMVTDNSGRSVSEHDYYAFGVTPTKAYQEQINWGDPHIDAMRFAGHQREFMGFINTENTDYLDYMHARYYDPNLGRFLSVDPGRDWNLQKPQSWNSYAYVRNDPVNSIDPDGRAIVITADRPPQQFTQMSGFLSGFSNSHQLDRMRFPLWDQHVGMFSYGRGLWRSGVWAARSSGLLGSEERERAAVEGELLEGAFRALGTGSAGLAKCVRSEECRAALGALVAAAGAECANSQPCMQRLAQQGTMLSARFSGRALVGFGVTTVLGKAGFFLGLAAVHGDLRHAAYTGHVKGDDLINAVLFGSVQP